mgnify:FL=1
MENAGVPPIGSDPVLVFCGARQSAKGWMIDIPCQWEGQAHQNK